MQNTLSHPAVALSAIRTHDPCTPELRVLGNAEQRAAITALRRMSASGVENDLRLELDALESARDEVGVVAALFRAGEAIATIRFVPSGYGLTGGERLAGRLGPDPDFLGPDNWEVGRLVVEPGERSPQLLTDCLTHALVELMRLRRVAGFYAIATPTMARLWRRFGMSVVARVAGESGTPYVVVHGLALAVAAALGVDSVVKNTVSIHH